MRIKITATKEMYKKARLSRGKLVKTCLVVRALNNGLGVTKAECGYFRFDFGDVTKSYQLPPKASELVREFDNRAANLPGRLPVSFFVSVPKKELEAARAAKG